MATRKKTVPAVEAAPVEAVASEVITTFKGFDINLSCRGYKYEVGGTYEMWGRIQACDRGFHACKNPFDVWNYYGPADGNRFAVVDQSGDLSRDGRDTKVASARITVTVELTLPDFIRRAVAWIIDRTAVALSGSSSGGTNDKGEDGAQIGSSGYGARIGSSGNDARIGSSGYGAQIGSSGNDAQIGSSGYGARIGSSGNGARIDASGEKAVIASAGRRVQFKAAPGAWISLAEYDDAGACIGFASGCVGRDGIPADTWLRAKGGKLVEVA